jgi:hypothetical protein
MLLLLLMSCGIKPSASCDIDLKKKEALNGIKDSCIKNPTVTIKKEF